MAIVSGVTMSYGGYNFKPVPMVTISRESYKTSRTTIGGVYTISINGTLIPYTTGEDLGPIAVFNAKTEMITGFKSDFGCFEAQFTGVNCGQVILKGRPKVESISFDTSADNNSKTMPYSIELSFAGSSLEGIEDYLGQALNLESVSTSYNISYIEKPYSFVGESHGSRAELGRTITAKGLTVGWGNEDTACTKKMGAPDWSENATGINANSGNYIDPLVPAIDYIGSVVGTGSAGDGKALSIPEFAQQQKIFKWPGSTGSAGEQAGSFLIDRSLDIDEHEGSVTLNDTFLIFATGDGYITTDFPVTDSFSVNIDSDISDGVVKVSTQGSIVGYPNYKVSNLFVEDGDGAFNNASGYFSDALTGSGAGARFFSRCDSLYTGVVSDYTLSETADGNTRTSATANKGGAPLNPQPISRSYGYNIKEGTVDYSLSYSTRPPSCLTGANILSEQISITRNRPTPIHASLVVLGRSSGPILQDIGTQTAYTADLSIEAVVLAPNACNNPLWFDGSPDYNSVVATTETDIWQSGNNTYFKTADSESFDVKTGRYTRSVSWVYTACP